MRYGPAETAQKSGFSLDTLRYYEKIGLLHGIGRDAAGRRVFNDDDLAWLGILRCLRETGMPIAAMLRYAELCREGDQTAAERLALLDAHDAAVGETIGALLAQREHLRAKIAWYRG